MFFTHLSVLDSIIYIKGVDARILSYRLYLEQEELLKAPSIYLVVASLSASC